MFRNVSILFDSYNFSTSALSGITHDGRYSLNISISSLMGSLSMYVLVDMTLVDLGWFQKIFKRNRQR